MNGLYAITESDSKNLLEKVQKALDGGIGILQYRNKTADVQQQLKEVTALFDMCGDYQVPLIINDNVKLAHQIGADGVHLGREDGSISEARELLGPDAIIGVSCYQDVEMALQAERLGANYIAFGSFFPSPTKPNAPIASLELLQMAKRQLSLPVCCIGGITQENAPQLLEAGADMIAVISSLFATDDIEKTTREFSTLFGEN